MRKTLFLCFAMAIAMMIMPSCKKDKDVDKQIVGKWTITSVSYAGETMSDFANATWEFKENGNFYGALIFGDGPDYVTSKYTIDGNKLTLSGGEFDDVDDWSIRRIELTVDDISSKNLEVSGSFIGDNEEGGTWKQPTNYKFKK